MNVTRKKSSTGAAALEVPVQSEESRGRALANASKGSGSATGIAQDQLAGHEDERRASLENEGSPNEVAGGDSIQGQYADYEAAEPVGLQAEPATFTTNGTVDPTMVASTTGLVPVGSVAANVEDATARLEAQNKALDEQLKPKRSSKLLDDATIERLSGPELRAVAYDRGYGFPQGGSRTTRERFRRAQADDKSLKEVLKEEAAAV